MQAPRPAGSTTIPYDEDAGVEGQDPYTPLMKGVDERTPLLLEQEVTKGLLEEGTGVRETSSRRPIGTVSAIFIIFNRIIGTGWVGLGYFKRLSR